MTEVEGERILGLARAQCMKLMELDKQIAKSKSYLSAVRLLALVIHLLLSTILFPRLYENENIAQGIMAARALWARKVIIQVHLVSKYVDWLDGTRKCHKINYTCVLRA
jgi:hypothetical protein